MTQKLLDSFLTASCQAKSKKCAVFLSAKNTEKSLSQGRLSWYSRRVSNTTTAAAATATVFTKKRLFESYEMLLSRRLEEIKEINRNIKYYGLKETAKSMDFFMDVLSQKIAETLEDIAKDIYDLDDHELEDSVELREQIETIASGELYNKSDAM